MRAILTHLAPYLKPYRWRLVLVVGCTIAAILSESLGLALFIPLLNLIFGGNATPDDGGLVSRTLGHFIASFPADRRLIIALMVIGLLTLAKSALSYAAAYLTDWTRYRLVSDTRVALQRNLYTVGYQFITKLKQGNVMFTFTNDANYVGILLAHIFKFITSALTTVIFLGLLLAISWQLTLLAAAFALLIGYSVQFTVRVTRERAKVLARTDAELSEAVHESWGAMRLARSIGTEGVEVRRIVEKTATNFFAVLRKVRFFNLTLPLSEFVGALGLIVIIWVGASGWLAIAPAEIIGITLIIIRLLPYVSSLNQTRSQIAADSSYALRLFDLIGRRNKPYLANGSTPLPSLTNGLVFEDVRFSYADRAGAVVDHLSLSIPRGTTTAVVGPSGSGKSTFLDLVLRFYDPVSGRILVDGHDLRNIKLEDWHALVGVVNQENFTFNASIAENIRYAKPDASDEEVRAAARSAYAQEFIEALPRQYDTVIGDRGVLLSGGQRQRIAIARAVIRNPQVLIFDEATSALDSESERAVQTAIRELARDRTILIVAHRLSTIEHADQIVVLDGGRIAEVGRHHELLRRNGLYARLYQQASSTT